MYSGSRGILYTAPPGPDENDDRSTADEAASDSEESVADASEPAEGLAADD